MDLKEYNQLQIDEMEKHKWIESEKAGRDLGEAARREWIAKYAAEFRETHPIEYDKLRTDVTVKADNGVSSDLS